MDYRLLSACLTGDLPTVQKLVTSVHAENVDLNTKRGVLHFSPLHYACSGGHCEVAQYLIDKAGCDPNSRTQQGKTALHVASETGHLNAVRLLLQTYRCDPECRDHKGQTPLHLASCASIAQCLVEDYGCVPNRSVDGAGRNPLHAAVALGHADTAGYLLAEQHCDPNVPDGAGDSPLALTDKPNMIGKLLSFGANPASLHKRFKKYLPKPPTASFSSSNSIPVKVFVVGNISAGKTSLTRVLKKETLPSVGGARVAWDPPTAGIAYHTFTHKAFGRVVLYDCAGHEDYHSVHASFLGASVVTLPPIFVVVTDLSQGKEGVERDVCYWLGFLSNAVPGRDALVIVVGSRGDVVRAQGVDPSEWVDWELMRRTQPTFTIPCASDIIPIDCRSKGGGEGAELLCQALKEACEQVRARFSPTHGYYTHCFWLWLSNAFEDSTVVTVGELRAQLKGERTHAREKMELFELMKGHHSTEEKKCTYLVSILPEEEADLCDLCVELANLGHIFFHYDMANLQNSCIVFHQRSFLEDVVGTVFAPPGYRQHCYLATPTGAITMEHLAHKFEAYPIRALVRVLMGIECCLEVGCSQAPDFPSLTNPDAAEDFVFFPSLVTVDDPEVLWSKYDSQLTSCIGWMLRCSDKRQPLTRRFLHSLVLKLVRSHLLAPRPPPSSNTPLFPSLKRVCSIWKKGVFLADERGVKWLVELTPDHTQLIICVASHPSTTMCMARVFSSLLQAALGAKEDHSPFTPTEEFFLHPIDVMCYPLGPSPGLFPIADVARVVVGVEGAVLSHNGSPMELQDVIPFEPYYGLGTSAIGCIFDYPSSCLSVPADVSSKIASCLPLEGACLSSFENLRDRLNQYSIFAGRNPLVLAENQKAWPVTTPPPCTLILHPFTFDP